MTPLKNHEQLLWITWEKQVRNRSMSARLGAQLVELQVPGGRLKRYIVCFLKTSYWLWRWRLGVVFVQNPSLVLALQAVLLRPLLRYRLIVDAHNAGIYPTNNKASALQVLANWVIANANLVLVTNRGLADRVEDLGGTALIMPDPLPEIHSQELMEPITDGSAVKALFICTWAADEPYIEVFRAAKLLPHVRFYVTGNSKGREVAYGGSLPENIILTGYLPDMEYERLLWSSEVIIDLTTRENCLVCGAYEAVSVGRPFVLSDTDALKAYFRVGGAHVSNYANGISEGIQRVISNYDLYRKDIVRLKLLLESEWSESKQRLLAFIDAK